MDFFEHIHKQIYRKLKTLYDVGLGYIKLGQPSTHALRRRGAARQAGHRAGPHRSPAARIYILDEPTTGLHIGGRGAS